MSLIRAYSRGAALNARSVSKFTFLLCISANVEQDNESAKAGEQRREEGGESGEVQVGTGEVVKVGAACNECLRGASRRTLFDGVL